MSDKAKSNVKAWAKGLLAAAISGAVNSLGFIIVDPQHAGDIDKVLKLAGAGALIGVVLYLKKSPVWNGNGEEEEKPQ